MIKSLDTAKQGLLGQLRRNDVITNNLANVSTHGFKREIARQTVEPVPGQPNAAEMAFTTTTDFTTGSLTPTGSEFNVAIEDDGFFVVERDGEEYYTRVGDFRLNDAGQIVIGAGHILQGTSGPITIDPQEPGEPTIATDGTVMHNQNAKGSIRVVRFDDPGRLERAGENLFKAAEGQTAKDVDVNEIRLLTGFIEGSNVNPVKEMVSMLTALRSYQTMEKVVQSADETLDTMINRVGRLRGSG